MNSNTLSRTSFFKKEDIDEELFLIEDSSTDYITKSGKVYKDYGNGFYYLKKHYVNNKNGYVYIGITFKDGKNRNRRLHVLLAKMFIFNPNPKVFNIVGHKDNDKTNYNLSNLYWTTTQENTQKAVDDGLIEFKKGIINNQSMPVGVFDKDSLKLIGVYGSLRECSRCIKHVTFSSINKACHSSDGYKPRSKKFIYRFISLEDYHNNIDIQLKHLEENPPVNKKPKVFRLSKIGENYTVLLDNQTTAENITGINQSKISQLLKNKCDVLNGWRFEYIKEIDYTNSTSYINFVNTLDNITIQNIYDKRIMVFNTKKEMKDYLKLNGHGEKSYIDNNHLLQGQWKIIELSKNSLHS